MAQPTQTPCPHCGSPVYVLATTCVHCRGPLRFNPPLENGSVEAYRRLTGWQQPELPPIAARATVADETPVADGSGNLSTPIENGETDDSPTEAEFVFRPDGDGYFLKGFGEEGHVSKSKGMDDLFRLVQTPGIAVLMLELDAGPGVKRAEGDGSSRQPVADAKTFQQVTAKRDELKADIESAESEMEREELQAELDKLEASARAMKGLGGTSRDINNPTDKLRPKIAGRIETARRNIAKAMPEMGKHFDLTISSETGCYLYSAGVPNLQWDVSKKM